MEGGAASEASAASGSSAVEICILQGEILEQTKQIQQFIDSTDDDDSPAFAVLKSLFMLFKSELSVNLSLRKLLVDQKKSSESVESEIAAFLAEIRGLGHAGVQDFGGVLAALGAQARKLRRLKRASADRARQGEGLLAQLEGAQLREAEGSVAIASLNARLSQAAGEGAVLRQRLGAHEKEIQGLRALVAASEQGKRETEERGAALAKELAALGRRLEDAEAAAAKQSLYRKRHRRAASKIRSLNAAIAKLEEGHRKVMADMRAKSAEAQEASKRAVEELQKAAEHLKDAHRQEIEEIAGAHAKEIERHEEERAQLQGVERICEQQRAEIARLEGVVSELEGQKKSEDDEDQDIRHKYHKVVRKIQALKAELEQIQPMHEAEMQRLRDECEKKSKAAIKESLAAELSHCRLVEKELKFEINEQQLENKRLREQLRQYSFILEQKEGMLAKLQIESEMNGNQNRSSKRRTRESRADFT
jgi:chromosome segregation ATPase